ncbi:MAG TPA: transcriptional regulator, partial [Flavobacteriales bacterium]|nr:transcriptional regulator [Flavobacteriales bacterium]
MKKQELAKLENASNILKTVGHPMRIAIIELLRA